MNALVAFDRSFRKRLLTLDGEVGGRQILQQVTGVVRWLNLHDPGIYRDLDSPDQVDRMRRDLQAQYPAG